MNPIWDDHHGEFKGKLVWGGNGPTDPNPDVWYDTDDELD